MRKAALGLLAAVLLVLTFSAGSSGPARGDAASPTGIPPVQARIAEFRQAVRVQGSLRPEKVTRITSELSDLAITRVVAEGSQVRKGDVEPDLFRIFRDGPNGDKGIPKGIPWKDKYSHKLNFLFYKNIPILFH